MQKLGAAGNPGRGAVCIHALLGTEPETRCHPFIGTHSSVLRKEAGSAGKGSECKLEFPLDIQWSMAWSILETEIFITVDAAHHRFLRSKY